MTTLSSSSSDRTHVSTARTASTVSVPSGGAVLHLAGLTARTAHAALLPAAAVCAGIFAIGLQVSAVLYGDSETLARTALVLIGIWLILWAAGRVLHGLISIVSLMTGAGGAKAGGTSTPTPAPVPEVRPEVVREAPKETARPRLALPNDAPAQRYDG